MSDRNDGPDNEILWVNVRQVVSRVYDRRNEHAAGLYVVVLSPEVANRPLAIRAAIAMEIAVHYLSLERPADFNIEILDAARQPVETDPAYQSPSAYDKGSIEKISDEPVQVVGIEQASADGGAELDDELRELGALALRNAFYAEYSMLVARYLSAAEGLGQDGQDVREQLVELSNPFGASDVAGAAPVSIDIVRGGNRQAFTTMHGALAQAGDSLLVNGEPAFEWRSPIGWYFVDPAVRSSQTNERSRDGDASLEP